MKNKLFAYCWASGLIEFGPYCPDACLFIASSTDHQRLRDVVEVQSRHGKGASAGQYLVPGVPENQGTLAAVAAVTAFCQRVQPRLKEDWERSTT